MKHVCIFCGSRTGVLDAYSAAAWQTGDLIARQGRTLVYGGGKVGLMGIVADAALQAGGEVIGVIPDFLLQKEVGHSQLTELLVTPSMHVRKQKMMELSDGFLVLPGGIGTLEEYCEILTWRQLGLHQKPVGFLNVAGFFDPALNLFQALVNEGFLEATQLTSLLVEEHPLHLLEAMDTFLPPNKAERVRPEQM